MHQGWLLMPMLMLMLQLMPKEMLLLVGSPPVARSCFSARLMAL
jgi:hypothetical protein